MSVVCVTFVSMHVIVYQYRCLWLLVWVSLYVCVQGGVCVDL